MAENVKRRVAAARLAVAFVAAGTIAGATAWAQAGPPPPIAEESAAYLKSPKVTGDDIVDGSLFFKDFHKNEVPSSDAFLKYKKATTTFKKAINTNISNIKGELGDIKLNVDTIKGELVSGYLKAADADSRYIKLSDAVVRGDGSVFTDTTAVSAGPVRLLTIAGLVHVDAVFGQSPEVQIFNDSGAPLNHTDCGGAGGDGIVQPGQSFSCPADPSSKAVQLITAGGTVATLNFSALPAVQQGSMQFTTQILIGL
jgi:hypothetical protein